MRMQEDNFLIKAMPKRSLLAHILHPLFICQPPPAVVCQPSMELRVRQQISQSRPSQMVIVGCHVSAQ